MSEKQQFAVEDKVKLHDEPGAVVYEIAAINGYTVSLTYVTPTGQRVNGGRVDVASLIPAE